MRAYLQLRRDIESCELKHPAFVTHYAFLKQRIEDALEGFSPRLDWVVGPSRVGKSMLINALSREFPRTKHDGVHRVPVLQVPTSPSISPLLLPSGVLQALGVPLPAKGLTSGLMLNRMSDQLKLAGTKVLMFEEASHLVEPGAKLPPRAAGDWFKNVMDTLNITILMFGVPRLHKLFDSNEQLRLRASAKREFRPYDYRIANEFRAFAQCVKTYADLFSRHGYPIEVPLPILTKHTYLLSGGLIGVLSKFMQELACLQANASPHPLTIDDCVQAAACMETTAHPDCPAFMHEEVSPIEMSQAHSHTLEINDMFMPVSPPVAARGVACH